MIQDRKVRWLTFRDHECFKWLTYISSFTAFTAKNLALSPLQAQNNGLPEI